MQMYLINYILSSLTWQSGVKAAFVLFFIELCICNETNATKYLITYQIMFYVARPTKN
jgi:hypothetical protein